MEWCVCVCVYVCLVCLVCSVCSPPFPLPVRVSDAGVCVCVRVHV